MSIAQKMTTSHKSPAKTQSKPPIKPPPPPKLPTHQDIFNAKMQLPQPLSTAQGIVAIGTTFIGNPYPKSNIDTTLKTATGGTVLQPIQQEVLVVNLKKFDCVTFVESMIALTETRRNDNPTFDIFKAI